MALWKELQIVKLEKHYVKLDADLLKLKSGIVRGPDGFLCEKEFLRVAQAWDKIREKRSRLDYDIYRLKRELQGLPSGVEMLRVVNALRRQDNREAIVYPGVDVK